MTTVRSAAPDAPETAEAPAVGVFAGDLIWASRLIAAVERTGLRPVRVAHAADVARLTAGSPGLTGLLVDVGSGGSEAIAVLQAASAARLRALGVAQHEDAELRRRAVAAGAGRVFSYRKFFEDGPALVARWFSQNDGTPQERFDP